MPSNNNNNNNNNNAPRRLIIDIEIPDRALTTQVYIPRNGLYHVHPSALRLQSLVSNRFIAQEIVEMWGMSDSRFVSTNPKRIYQCRVMIHRLHNLLEAFGFAVAHQVVVVGSGFRYKLTCVPGVNYKVPGKTPTSNVLGKFNIQLPADFDLNMFKRVTLYKRDGQVLALGAPVDMDIDAMPTCLVTLSIQQVDILAQPNMISLPFTWKVAQVSTVTCEDVSRLWDFRGDRPLPSYLALSSALLFDDSDLSFEPLEKLYHLSSLANFMRAPKFERKYYPVDMGSDIGAIVFPNSAARNVTVVANIVTVSSDTLQPNPENAHYYMPIWMRPPVEDPMPLDLSMGRQPNNVPADGGNNSNSNRNNNNNNNNNSSSSNSNSNSNNNNNIWNPLYDNYQNRTGNAARPGNAGPSQNVASNQPVPDSFVFSLHNFGPDNRFLPPDSSVIIRNNLSPEDNRANVAAEHSVANMIRPMGSAPSVSSTSPAIDWYEPAADINTTASSSSASVASTSSATNSGDTNSQASTSPASVTSTSPANDWDEPAADINTTASTSSASVASTSSADINSQASTSPASVASTSSDMESAEPAADVNTTASTSSAAGAGTSSATRRPADWKIRYKEDIRYSRYGLRSGSKYSKN